MRVAGIDPGKKGVCVVISTGCSDAWVHHFIYDKAGLLDGYRFWEFLVATGPGMIMTERVRGRGEMGASQTFNFGFAAGQTAAVATLFASHRSVIRYYGEPQAWQKLMHSGIPAGLEPKERSRLAYERLFPHRPIPGGPRGGKVDDNVIDALLIASYAVQTFAKAPLQPWVFKTGREP